MEMAISFALGINFGVGSGTHWCVEPKRGCVASKYGTYHYYNVGAEIDANFGLEFQFHFLTGRESIPGWAGGFTFGYDLPIFEFGASFELTHNFAAIGEQTLVTGLGFSVGVGLGVVPLDMAWSAVTTVCWCCTEPEDVDGYDLRG